LAEYRDAVHGEQRVTFCGRLGTYRYIDMDVAIAEALDVASRWIEGDRRALYV
jgi:UDP-galactopyranose mutase